MKKYIAIILSLILVISMMPVCAVAAEDITPYVQLTDCPNCGEARFANYGSIVNEWEDTPIPGHCELPNDPMWDDHLHEYTESYVLCRCLSCGYETKTGYSLYEHCPVLGFNFRIG